MKKYLNWIGFALLLINIVACRKDLGNYTYQDINEISITGMQEEYNALAGQALTIEPKLTFSKDANPQDSNYTYLWFAIQNNKQVTLSIEKNMTQPIALIPAVYKCFYRITDKRTGVMSEQPFRLTVTTEIATGWLVLNSVRDTARLDMLNYNLNQDKFIYYNDILRSTNSVKLKGKPKLIRYVYRQDPFNSSYIESLFVGTDQSTIDIINNGYDWKKFRNLSTEVLRPTSPNFYAEKIIPMGIASTGSAKVQNYILGSDGAVSLEDVVTPILHGAAINRLSGGTLPVSSFMAVPWGNANPYLVMYDTQNKRFLVNMNRNPTAIIPSADPKMFDPGSMNMDLLFMDYTIALSGQFYALFKATTGQIMLTRFIANSAVFVPQAFDVVIDAPDIDKADFYAIDPSQGYVMYSVDSKIYQYDPFIKKTKLMLDVGARKISLMKYQRIVRRLTTVRYAEYSKKLMVCTYDEGDPDTSGNMELYTVPNLNGALTPYQSYSGFGRIVDVSYRE